MPPTPIAVAVVVDRGRVLVGRRSRAAIDAAGMDEFPGGKAEPGESLAVAAVRECGEEAGVAIEIIAVIDTAAAVATSGPIEITFFHARLREPAVEPRPPYAWVPIPDLVASRFPAPNARAIEWLRDHHGGS